MLCLVAEKSSEKIGEFRAFLASSICLAFMHFVFIISFFIPFDVDDNNHQQQRSSVMINVIIDDCIIIVDVHVISDDIYRH
jgi:hypothetical protein